MLNRFVLTAAAALLASTALAQTPPDGVETAPEARGVVVHLKNGGSLSGVLRENGAKLVLEVDAGTVGLDSSMVERLEFKDTPLSEYYKLEGAVAQIEDLTIQVQARERLLQFALKKGLGAAARKQAEKIIALADPSDPAVQDALKAAHTTLGHEQVNGEWKTKAEAMKAKGYVWFRGNWVKKEEKEAIEKRERDQAEERKRKAEREKLERERRRLESERASLEEQRRRLEAETTRPRVRVYTGWSYGSPYYYGYGWNWSNQGNRHHDWHQQPHNDFHYHPQHGTHYGPHQQNHHDWHNRSHQPQWPSPGRHGGHR